MKKLLLSLSLAAASVFSVMAQTPAEPAAEQNQAEIKFETLVHDFGSVNEGPQAIYEFKFTNTGNAPLIISNATASCGCTVPEWTKEPIAPGKTGVIKVVYNTSGRPGVFSKTVTITSNGKTSSVYLTIKGNVIQKAAQPESPVISPNNN